jgi:(p)ppGpp synthase/HD superfamily hydrolase
MQAMPQRAEWGGEDVSGGETMILEHDIRVYIEAIKWAHELHQGQKYGDYPYTRHLAHVENVLSRFGFNESSTQDLIAAAWLHDAMEDCGLTAKKIIERLGSATIARMVSCVTDGEGQNRKERKRASYEKMADYPHSIPLKLADRIANVESGIKDNPNLLAMYRKEHQDFRKQLHHASLTIGSFHSRVFAMWEYLDGLMAEYV